MEIDTRVWSFKYKENLKKKIDQACITRGMCLTPLPSLFFLVKMKGDKNVEASKLFMEVAANLPFVLCMLKWCHWSLFLIFWSREVDFLL